MTITWHGYNYFRLQNGDLSVVLNPYALDKSGKVNRVKSDIVLFSNPDKVDDATFDKESFLIDSPGEYEVKDVFVYGRPKNGQIIFLITIEDIKVAFLGDYGHQEITEKDLELIEGADILILPVGGGDLTTAKEAVKIIGDVEPRIVIPSAHAAGMGRMKADNVSAFIKEFGVQPEETDKYRIQKKNLPQDDVKLVVLKP